MSGSQECLAIGGESYWGGIKVMGDYSEGAPLVLRPCSEVDWTQMWGWEAIPL